MQQRLFGSRPPDPPAEPSPRPSPEVDLADPDGVKLAYALRGARPVFAGKLLHLARKKERPTFTCVACEVPVHVVLPQQGAARKISAHFRHERHSPGCPAVSNHGALLWNVKCSLHAALQQARPLLIRRHCAPHANPWAASPLLPAGSLFAASTPCEATEDWPVPPWTSARLGRSPDLRLVGDHGTVLAIALRTPSITPTTPSEAEWIELHVTEASYGRLMAWSADDGALPAAAWSPALSWRCAAHG